MSQLSCLIFILLCFGACIGFIVLNVKVLGRRLRRTANDDIKLLDSRDEAKFPALADTVHGLITVESAFASVTVAVLFVVVGVIISGAVTLPETSAPIVLTAITALAIATVCWILSLEMLSHLISPSLSDDAFGPVYQEALNLWNIGFLLLLLSMCLVLIPVSATVAASVAAITTVLGIRTLALVHQWGPVTLREMPVQAVSQSDGPHQAPNPWRLTLGLALLVAFLFPLYGPLNRPTEIVHYMSTPIDSIIPFWPLFVLPYLSYFIYILVATMIPLVRRNRTAFERFSLALLLTLAVSYLFYGFFQTGMHRPDLGDSYGWLTDILAKVYHSDNPYNAFPSSHASITTVCCLSLLEWRRLRPVIIIWAILIIASTVLVKQHYLADALAGVLLGALSFWIAGYSVRSRQKLVA